MCVCECVSVYVYVCLCVCPINLDKSSYGSHNAIYPVFIICTFYFFFIHNNLTALCNLLGKLVNILVYLHYVL